MPINIHPISGDFNETVYQFLRKQEGFAPRIYSDSKGIPTLGVGYALAVKGSNGSFAVRSTLPSDLALMGVTLTAADAQLLDAAIAALNSENMTRAKTLIPVFKQGENSAQVNKFSFLLSSPDQFRPLFDRALDEATITLRSKIGVPLFSSLAGSNEMAALLSLTFNSPELIGGDLINALETGNRVEAWYEIRYQSNGGQSPSQGIATRRYAESDLFGQYDGVNGQFPATEIEARQVLAYLHQPNIEEQILRYEGQFKLPQVGAGGLDRYTQPAEGFLIIAFADPLGIVVANVVAANPNGPAGDALVGTEESDLLLGAISHDVLIGGGGDDLLRGEEGRDVYVYNSGDGNDTILDTDGQGVVVFDHQMLQGGLKKENESVYTSLDGEITYQRSGADLMVNGALTIMDWQEGRFGIRLKDLQADPEDPGVGDVGGGGGRTEFLKIDHYVQVGNLPDGTPIFEPVYADFFDNNANNTLSGQITPAIGNENNLIFALGGNDTVLTGAGDDELHGGDGVDVLVAERMAA